LQNAQKQDFLSGNNAKFINIYCHEISFFSMLGVMMTDELDLSSAQRLQLKPNCLLTRREIVFLTPPRSLFFYKNPWVEIMTILSEHGYKTRLFQLPFHNIQFQKKVITRGMDNLNHKHLILDCVTYANLFSELQSLKNSTITVIATNNNKVLNQDHFWFNPAEVRFSLSYWFHQKWCVVRQIKTPNRAETMMIFSKATWHALIDHCVRLAELDFEIE
jgi:hypothetical protein